jgi:hypothetical protein
MTIQENHVELKLYETHQLMAYADDVNLLGDKIYTLMKNKEPFIDVSREVDLEVWAKKNKYVLLFHQWPW